MTKRPEQPDEASESVAIRQFRADRHVSVYTYKDSVILTTPSQETPLWLSPDQADRIAAALRSVARAQRKLDAWALKHEPRSLTAQMARLRKRGR